MPLSSLRPVLLCALALALPLAARAQLPALAERTELRRALHHAELLEAWMALGQNGDADEKAAAAVQIAILAPERALLEKLGPMPQLRAELPKTLAARLALQPLTAQEWLTLAGFCAFHELRPEGEAALGHARDLDPSLKAATDAMLAVMRGEQAPPGGYLRYRGAFLHQAERDRARAVDEALISMTTTDIAGLLPFPIDTERTAWPRFLAMGERGPEVLRDAAAHLRRALAADYEQVRASVPSYGKPRLRALLLEKRAAMRADQHHAIELIQHYDKPQQDEVDQLRRKLEKAWDDYAAVRDRDQSGPERLRADDAYKLLRRIEGREQAMAAIDGCLGQLGATGLEPCAITPAPESSTTAQHVLPGRRTSGLEDVLWCLLQLRAEQITDTMQRAEELLRQRSRLTPWEALVVEDIEADAVEAFDERVACSLHRTERQFVRRLNRYRRVLGLRPFEIEERLDCAARKHSQEMIDLGYFGHISPIARNRGPTDRVRLEGYAGGVGENCLAGQVDGDGAFEGWYHSPGHHRNLISQGIHLGVGAVADDAMWTMVCGGDDRTWRGLHHDVAPAEQRDQAAFAQRLALALRDEPVGEAALAQRHHDLSSAAARLPAILPAIARIAFAASTDPRDPNHAAHPALLRIVMDADVATVWRPLQVAVVAALIETLASPSKKLREQALALLRPHLDDTFGYDADAPKAARDVAVVEIRRHWQDVAQWRFHQHSGALPPVAATIPTRVGDGPSRKARMRVLSKRERAQLARRFGGGTQTELAIDRGLAFLARVQDADGAWRARSFPSLSPRFKGPDGAGSAEWELAMTGLCLLAFTATGNTPDQGEYAPAVVRGMEFLLRQMVDYGRFETTSSHYMYGHAIATQALCELYAYTAEPRLGACAQLAVDYLLYAQDRESGGWRYEPGELGDTSVSGWVILALNAAHKAGLEVAGQRGALRFLDGVTQPGYYRVGYQNPFDDGAQRNRLAAVAMTCRMFLGVPKGDPRTVMAGWRLRDDAPARDRADFYYWYYGTLALFQLGGDFWRAWNDALVPALLALQETAKDAPFEGAWPIDGQYGKDGGRIMQTALGVLMLTVYYRYEGAPKLRLAPSTGNIVDQIEPFLRALRTQPDDVRRAVILRTMVDQFGPALTPILVPLLAERKEKVELRRELAATVMEVAEPKHEAMILPLLADPDGAVCVWLSRALVRIATADSVVVLLRGLDHDNREVRGYSARALGRLGDPAAAPALAKRLDIEQDGFCKHEIELALRRIAHREAIATAVDDAWNAKKPGRLDTIEALDVLEQNGIGKLLLARKQAEPRIYAQCLQAIQKYEAASAIPLLLALLESEQQDVREESLKLLRALSGQDCGFDPKQSVAQRRRALQLWQRWWKEHEHGFVSK